MTVEAIRRDSDIQAYIKCMEEIKRRLNVVDLLLKGKINTGFPITNAELLAVQLRKVAELIALSSICSHREEYQKLRARFETDWKAGAILRDVERINPHHYPRPSRQVVDPNTGKSTHTIPITDGYLTKEHLVDVVDECSAILHAFNPYQNALPRLEEFTNRCIRWRSEILTLLSHHQLQLVDSASQWWVIMQAKSDGKVHVAEMQQIDGPAKS